jgi:hypothetical protein
MRVLKALLFLVISSSLVLSCQKELNFDLDGQSRGTLKYDSTSFECLPSTVNGVYQADSILGDENYIDVHVNVTTTGTYIVQSDTVNGYSFRGTGTFGAAGLNTVRIYGTGKPLIVGVNTFIVKYDSSFCLIDVNVIAGNTPPDAVYTFGGSGATCTGSVVSGTYMQGLPMTPGNAVQLQITVTSPGAFQILTDTLNGVSFSASGIFSMGNSTVTLVGSGTPTATGTFNFLASGSGNGCSFSITFDPPGTPAVFTLGGAPGGCSGTTLIGTYSVGVETFPVSGATISVNVTSPGTYVITSPVINGISFTGSGIFTTTGNIPVNVYASGTPVTSGSFDYPLTGNASTCSFSVPVSGTPTDYIICKLDNVATTFNVNAQAGLINSPGVTTLSIDGSSVSTSFDPSISMRITKTGGGSISSGVFDVNQLASGIDLQVLYNDAASVNYFVGTDATNQSQTPGFTITITSITGTRVAGTFSGTIKENGGAGPAGINVTEGIFSVPF